ncbi:MAG: putative pyruvate formate lyase activating enzyme [Thermodesulfobacteriota bacterium]|nr:putative pyruvate formate lyase activating enzyme [Thermodesulfobacteriota bacterium]
MREPSCLRLYREGEFAHRVKKALDLMSPCRLCPRKCGVDRLNGETGYCRTGRQARVASYNAHFWEEAPLVGRHGSGTLFFSSCNLLCCFCQNFEISHLNEGVEVLPDQVAAMMIELMERGCHNINLVTPTHVMPQILEALEIAIAHGLTIPIVYNSGGYESVETLRLLDGVVDIYMPDFKFWEDSWGERFCHAPDYRVTARAAIREMHRQVGDLVIDSGGIAVRGLLVRHLVMPNGVAGTADIMNFLSKEISLDTYVNIMDQYRPCGQADADPAINRRLTSQEYREAVAAAGKAGLNRLDSRDRPRIILGF